MLSEGQVHVMNAGDSVVLDCSFHADAYNLFDYPVLWRKTQRDEETQASASEQSEQLIDIDNAANINVNVPRLTSSHFRFVDWIKSIEVVVAGVLHATGSLVDSMN